MGIKKLIHVEHEKSKNEAKSDMKKIDKKSNSIADILKRLEAIEKLLRI